MADEKQSASENDFPESPQEISSFSEPDTSNPVRENVNSNSSQNEAKPECHKHPDININIPKEDWEKRETVRANSIARNSFIATIALFGITLATFWITKQSVDIANDGLKDSRKKDAIAVIRERRIDSLDSIIRQNDFIRDTTNMAMTRQSVADQYNSLRQTQKRFEVENEPFLEITIPGLPNFQENEPLIISGIINNLGKYPCRVKKMTFAMEFTNGYPAFEQIRSLGLNNAKIVNTYITNNMAGSFEAKFPTGISKEQVESIMTGHESFFFWGYINYENLMSKEEKNYTFMIKFFYYETKGSIAYEFLTNDNRNGGFSYDY